MSTKETQIVPKKSTKPKVKRKKKYRNNKSEVKVIEKAAKEIGERVKLEKIPRGVTFLAQNDLKSIMRAITVPLQNPPVRYSGNYSTDPTAVASPWSVFDVPWDTTNASNDEQYLIMFREPLRAVIFNDNNVSGAAASNYIAYIYDTVYDNFSTAPLYTWALADANTFMMKHVQILYLEAQSVYQPHGPYLYPGRDNVQNLPGRFFWCDINHVIVFTVTAYGGAGGAGIEAQLIVWEGGKTRQVSTVLLNSSTTFNVTAVLSGYYAIRLVPQGLWTGYPTLNLQVQLQIPTAKPVSCHLSLPFLNSNIGSAYGIRMIGICGMYSNTTSTMDNQGDITACQMKKEESWTTVTTFDDISNRVNAFNGSAKKGCYGFLRPTSESDFNESRSYMLENSELAEVGFPLQPESDFMVYVVRVKDVNGRSGKFTTSYSIDYSSLDTWRDVSNVRVPPNVFSGAAQATSKMVQFYENPLHVSDIFTFIQRAAKAVQKYGPALINIAGLVTGKMG